MNLYHCRDCHHEWEGSLPKCAWCGSPGKVLDTETPMSRMIKVMKGKFP